MMRMVMVPSVCTAPYREQRQTNTWKIWFLLPTGPDANTFILSAQDLLQFIPRTNKILNAWRFGENQRLQSQSCTPCFYFYTRVLFYRAELRVSYKCCFGGITSTFFLFSPTFWMGQPTCCWILMLEPTVNQIQ